MRNFDLKRLQQEEFKILLEVDRICKKHNIKYSLSWGSVLGAVRHNGFIPWDDDIDISIFWDDYIRFQNVCKDELDEEFFLQTTETDKNYWQPWIKIRKNGTTCMQRELSHMECHWGIGIDIFPIISIPNSRISRIKQKTYTKIYKLLCLRPYLLKHKNSMLSIGFKLIPNKIYQYLKSKSIRNIIKYNSDNYDQCGEILDYSYSKCIMNKKIFTSTKDVLFEDRLFPIPIQYDEYLTKMYGEYMTLPDEKDRIGHGDLVVDFEKSYLEYIGK